MDSDKLNIGFILNDYIQNVPLEYREAVIGSVMKAKLIKDAFDDPRGKQILEAAVTMITGKVQDILELCKGLDTSGIEKAATEINVIQDYLRQWAKIYSAIPQIENETIKKMKKRS